MGALAYGLWWLAHRPHDTFPYDALALCALLSLDASTWLRWWIWRRSFR